MTAMTPSATASRALPQGTANLATGDVRVSYPYPDGCSRTVGPADQPYPDPAGLPELRAAIAGYATGCATVTADQVLVTPGARVAVLLTLLQATGRDVLVPTPCWGSYPALIRAAGAHPVSYGSKPTMSALDAARTPRTAIVVVNSPRNPDGAVAGAAGVTDVLDWAGQHHIVVLFDQVYRGVCADPTPSPVDITDELPEHCVIVDGLTKSHAAAGIRLGWAITPALLPALTAAATHLIGGVSSRTQHAGVELLREPPAARAAFLAQLASQTRHAAALLDSIDGVRCPPPEGGFFLFPDLRGWLETAAPGRITDISAWLRDEHLVAVVDGDAFGAPGHIRLSAAVTPQILADGLQRLHAAFAGPATT